MASIITERQLTPLLGCARAPISPAGLERGGHVLLPSLPIRTRVNRRPMRP
jgi:hypothetical protein